MKKPYFYLNIFVAIVATMLAACNVGDIDISIVPNTPTVTTLNFSSNMESDESARTAYNGETIVWSKDDKIRMAYTVDGIWQNATDGKAKFYASNYANTNEECTRATFSVPGRFESNDGGIHQFYVLYPSSAVSSTDIEAPYADVKINNTQTASATTFDKDADIMIGRSVESYEALPTQDEQIRLVWNRLVAHGFITLTNLDADGESVNSVTLTAANGTKLTGTYPINITDGKINEAKEAQAQAHNNVTLQFNETTIGDDKKLPFWFCSLPFETSYIKVEVDTEHYTFCREITLEGKTLNFQQNKRNTLAINMTNAVRTEKTAGVNKTDVIDLAFTGTSGTSYSDWSGKEGASRAVYAGNSAGGNNSVQLRSATSDNSTLHAGIITTASAGKVTKVVVTWHSETADGRTLNVYGKNTAYSEVNDLYNNTDKQGTLLGTIVCGKSAVLDIEGDYEYIGLRSENGAMYLEAIYIVWGEGDDTQIPIPTPELSIAEEVSIAATGGDESIDYTIKYAVTNTSVNAKTDCDWITNIDYSTDNKISFTVAENSSEEPREGVITITYGDITKNVTVKQAGKPAEGGESGVAQYVKVTSTTDITSGTYLIVYEAKAYVFNGGLATTSIDAAGNYQSVTISNNTIESNATTDAMAFVYDASNKSFKGVGGAYIGRTSNSNGMDEHATTVRTHSSVTISNGNAIITSSGGPNLQFYDSGSNSRFRYYSTTQKAIQLYKLTGGNGGSDTPATPTQLATPSVTASASGNTVTVTWGAITGAKDYTVKCGSLTQTVTTTSASFSGLTYSTKYDVSVVAHPSDTTANTDSEAGTATVTTDPDPNAGGGEGGSSEPITKTINLTGGSGTNGASWNFTSSPVTCTVVTNGNSTAPRLDSNLLRMYASNGKSNLMTITTNSSPKKKVTKVIVYCTSSDYATALNNGAATVDSGASVSKSKSGNNVVYTITGNTESISITTGGQARMNKIDVTYTD